MPSDDFNRANANPLDGSWTTGEGGYEDVQLVSNRVRSTGTGEQNVARHTDTFDDDHYSQVEFVTGDNSNRGGPMVRLQSGADESGYQFHARPASAWFLYYIDDGLGFNLLDNGSHTYSLPDTLRLEVSGTTLDPKINGVSVGTTTHATVTSGYPGIYMQSTVVGNVEFDDWEGANLAADPIGFDEDEEQAITPLSSADDQGPTHPRYIRIQNSLFLDKKIDGDVMITIGYREVPIGTN